MMEAAGSSLDPEEVSTKNKKEKNEEHEKRRKDARSSYMMQNTSQKLAAVSCALRSSSKQFLYNFL